LILIIAPEDDDHTTAVTTELSAASHPFAVVDTGQFPRHASVVEQFNGCERSFTFASSTQQIDLQRCGAAWWRRPQPLSLHPGIAADATSFVYGECHEAVAGLWPSLPAKWVNEPQLDSAAHHKPYQLAMAAEVGLTIPRTLITNDPDAARGFVREIGLERTVYKTFLANEQCWRETRIMRQQDLCCLDALRLAPVIFQEYVAADADLRITLIGPFTFATAIRAAPGGYEVDYRMDMLGASFSATSMPDDVEQRLRALLRRLGLVYGAIDLRRTPTGEYVFLEVNPAGEWRFVEDRTGQPMTKAMSQLLRDLDGDRPLRG